MDENKSLTDWATNDITKWPVDELKSLLSKLELKAWEQSTSLFIDHCHFRRITICLKNTLRQEPMIKAINNSFKFKTSMDKSIIPPPSGEWTADCSFQTLIKVTTETILIMYLFKRQGRKGQYRKAKRMFLFPGK